MPLSGELFHSKQYSLNSPVFCDENKPPIKTMRSEQSESTDMQCGSTAVEEQQTQASPESENPPAVQQNPGSLPSLPLQQDSCAEIVMNMALYDPPRWGWTALGGMADVLTPHERSRRFSTCRSYKSKKRTRCQRKCAIGGVAGATETALHSKDTPSHSAVATADKLISSENQTAMEQNSSSSSSEPISSSAPTSSQSISDNPSQQKPQHTDAEEPNSESKTTIDTVKSITPSQIPSGEASIVEGNDLNCSQETKPEQRQDASVDAERKTNNPLDIDGKTPLTNTEAQKIAEDYSNNSEQAVAVLKEKTKNDAGLEIVGISTRVLGMTIGKQVSQQSTTDGNCDGHDQEDDTHKKEGNTHTPGRRTKKYGKAKSRRSVGGVVTRTKYDCHVRSLGSSSNLASDDFDENYNGSKSDTEMVLDMYAYHQGREGMEARDAETGELLCTQQVTDTNHDFDAPKSTFPVHIEFPLEDEDEMDENDFEGNDTASTKRLDGSNQNFANEGGKNNNAIPPTAAKSSMKKTVAKYQETLTWNLLDPSTPTPHAFALSIGAEYGLSFGQIMDLATRIDKQIQKHVTETSHYREPIATREPIQELTQPRKLGPIRQPYRFDEVLQTGKEGGTFKPKRDGRVIARPRSSVGVSKKTKGGKSSLASPEASSTTKKSITDKREKGKKNAVVKDSDVSLEDELDDELLEEVRKRSNKEQVRETLKPGVLKNEKSAICHICKKRVPLAYSFPCSVNNHVYCDSHVQHRLGISKVSGVYLYDSCPICTLACECAKCVRKLKNVATLLKAKSITQRVPPHKVDFPNILSACKSSISAKELSQATDVVLEKKLKEIRKKREEIELQNEAFDKDPDKSPDKKSRTILLAGQTMVPKPPLSEFPRELHDDIDFDANATAAYFTSYSSDGQRSVNEVPDAWLNDERAKPGPDFSQLSTIKSSSEVQEDGNVDYCHICKTAGHLILCDYCPRGFHQDCLKNNRLSQDGESWECFVCKNEKTMSDEHFLDGKESIDVISASFSDLDAMDDHALVGLEVLSIIHEMLTKLIDYDFGFIFSKPVDVSLVPGYTDIVKCPMDIGTILSKLENKEFAELLDGNFSMDDLVTKILNDIELIWRNCIMFNVIGSSVARMALVLRRRVETICKQSIFPKLSDQVKTKVLNYARKFDEAWASGITASLSEQHDDSMSDDWKFSAITNLKPKSTRSFSAKPSSKATPIAILDTVSGRVVKLYSSHKSASKAVDIILKSGHRCEWNANSGLNLKLVAEKSKSDPNTLLFGYRWLFLDDLNAGNVTFLKSACDHIEVRHSEFTSLFRSIEEALSSFQLSKTADINSLRKKLRDLPQDGSWVEMDGLNWRRPVAPKQRPNPEDPMTSEAEDVESGPNLVSDSESLLSWKSCAFLKKDLVTDQFLVGFDSIDLAHQDWMQSAVSSPTFPSSEAQTMENFKKYYLDGDRNIDGLIWQTGDGSRRMENDEKKETTNNESVSHEMEVEEKSESKVQEENSALSQSRESANDSTANVSSSPPFSAIMSSHQRIVSEDPSATGKAEESHNVSGKRKHFEDNDRTDFSPNKEARLCSIVFVDN